MWRDYVPYILFCILTCYKIWKMYHTFSKRVRYISKEGVLSK